ncbi:tripartite tricarboxylate transporter substrate-binding protein [Roseomonas xinghualingensis]|uniref:tripartite tricarboxylate transporter substrate-binding protein n=1 Tax=Roseomonas xinghualingensis TaxID=2986475 RepID=UPI0021F1CFED|nr:tripartite tricarboxylate transporter substrate-binding protein [Roseomonas sp. SXEYE001]MCV4208901.1 tripartite tricarboxylate transporter substrate-binding protein [Roseomonas sp. SXEYE001]
MTTRRALLGALPLGAAAGAARAQVAIPYAPPGTRVRRLTLLVGAPSGSGTDLWVRGFAPFLERHMKQVQVSVVNQTGEGGLAAMRDLADAATDGSVMAYTPVPFLLARMVERHATALMERVRFLGAVTEEPVALVAPPGTELEALRAQWGGRPLALPPPASAAAIAAADLGAELPMEQLHFPSAAAARQAAMSGNTEAALLAISECVVAVREGKLAVLAIAGEARHPQFPETPTFREAALPLVAGLRRGFAVPAGTSPEAAARITRALSAAATDPEFLAQAEARFILPQFRDEVAWGALVTRDLAGLRSRWETSPWPVSGG